MQIKTFTLSFFTLLFITKNSWAQINSNGDFQIWNHYEIQKSVNDLLTVGVDSEFRYGNDVKQLHYIHSQLALYFQVTDWLILKPAYRQIWSQTSVRAWQPTYSPFLDVEFIAPIKKISLQNRNRFQYLIIPFAPNRFVYRFKLQLGYPIDVNSIVITPYINDELFFFESEGYNQNRFSVGSNFQFLPKFSASLYYMRRWFKFPRGWIYNNILGIAADFYF